MTAEPQVQGRLSSEPSASPWRRPLILSGVFALGATLLLADLAPRYAPGLLRFEHYLGDVRTARLSDQLASQHPSVAIVAITDDTLAGYRTYLPVDRDLLARVVEAVDAAGAKVIGLDFLFTSPAGDGNEILLIEAIRRARAKVVLAAADERIGLTEGQRDKQQAFFREVERPAGYSNLATERDSVVRFMAQPNAVDKPAYPKSFAALLADDPVAQLLRAGLKDKIVLIGGMLREIDTHLTPLTNRHEEKMHGVAIHAHMVAQMVDGRSVGQLETSMASLRLALAAVAALGFLVGWGFRRRRKGLLASGVASAVIIAIDTIVFWQLRIILPLVLALAAWFLGEFSGHYLGRWLGPRGERAMWFAR